MSPPEVNSDCVPLLLRADCQSHHPLSCCIDQLYTITSRTLAQVRALQAAPMAAHHVHAMDGEPSRKTQHASQRPAERSGVSFITAERIEAAKLLAAGGVAGAVSKSATAPLARLTILYQVDELAGAANAVVCRTSAGSLHVAAAYHSHGS